MRPASVLRAAVVVALMSVGLPASAQAPAEGKPPSAVPALQPFSTPLDGALRPAGAASGTDLNYAPPAVLPPLEASKPDGQFAHGSLRQIKLDYTWLPGIGNIGLQINDVELGATAAVPVLEGWAPLLITPGGAAHFWQGPKMRGTLLAPELPSSLYDAYVEFGWQPRLAPWLFADVAVTPGMYSDSNDLRSDSFQLRGRGLAIVAFSPQLQVVGGLLYVNRNKTTVLPAGGVVWKPDEDTKLNFLFPQPKLAHRLMTRGDKQVWGYLAGELGGGRWSVERADGAFDSLDYPDARVILGVECLVPQGLKGHVEVGYVFARKVNFTSNTPDYKPDSTLMVRAGFSY